jgi:hypothetical protein
VPKNKKYRLSKVERESIVQALIAVKKNPAECRSKNRLETLGRFFLASEILQKTTESDIQYVTNRIRLYMESDSQQWMT